MVNIEKFANPTRFLKLQKFLQPWVTAITIGLFAVGLYMSLVTAPPDYQQGETVRIMFVHVPASWAALMVYSIMALSSAIAIIFRHPLADVAAKTAAPIGAAFTFLALVTGSLWGKPMWGTYWVWDARLTSMFVLFLLYLGYMAIWQAVEDPHRAARIAAIVALVGFVNVPIIKFSVEWWNSLHQPASVFKAGGPSISSSILIPLLIMGLAYSFLFVTLHLLAIKSEIHARKIRHLQLAAAGRV
ncbi:MAG TPA: heme ABC transporter permease [Rhizobiales bacterium]|nr:heme ABC transporter permease [Hyphomicrobiales bacterium]